MISRYVDEPQINPDWSYYQAIARREQARAIHQLFGRALRAIRRAAARATERATQSWQQLLKEPHSGGAGTA